MPIFAVLHISNGTWQISEYLLDQLVRLGLRCLLALYLHTSELRLCRS